MTIEDGFCLAELIDGVDGDFAAAFRRLEALRLTRAARVHLESCAIWHRLLHAEGVGRDVRSATLADWDEAHMFDCLSLCRRPDTAKCTLRLSTRSANE